MTIKSFQTQFSSELSELFPQTEISSFFSILIEEYLGLKRIDLVLNPNFEIPQEKINLLKSALKKLKQEEPIQYIIGKTEFFGLPFYVDKNVLIPRPETEELVEWVISEASKLTPTVISSGVEKSLSILDIGTGSGCIPISIKKQVSTAKVSTIDVSEEALKTAQKNASLNEVELNFIHKDILEVSDLHQKYDIIISNPPYVRELEKSAMKKNVLENEPELALFVDDKDPLIFYRKIAELAKKHLNQNGLLFFEINEYLGKEMLEMLRLFGFKNVLLKKDIFGKDRMIKASI